MRRGDHFTSSRFLYNSYLGTKSGKLLLLNTDSPTREIAVKTPSLSLAMKSCCCFCLESWCALSCWARASSSWHLGFTEQELLCCCILLSLLAGTWERGADPSCALRVPVCPVALFLLFHVSRARQDPCLRPVCCAGVTRPVSRTAPVSELSCCFSVSPSLSILRGFPLLPKNALSDMGSAPSFVSSGAGVAGR